MFQRSLMAVNTADAVANSSNQRDHPWHDLKGRTPALVNARQVVTEWIIDETHNLWPEFFRHLRAFLDFAFDARDVMTTWVIGRSILAQTLERTPHATLRNPIQGVSSYTSYRARALCQSPRWNSSRKPPSLSQRKSLATASAIGSMLSIMPSAERRSSAMRSSKLGNEIFWTAGMNFAPLMLKGLGEYTNV